jgi:hypothetical protein
MRFLKPLINICLFSFALNLHAKEFFEYGQSIRALGMGNAYTAVVNDGDALFYNPAALGRVKGINLTIINLNTGFNGKNAYDSYQNYQNSTETGIDKFTDLFGLSDVRWLNEKLILMRPWWGRIAATDLIFDVEREKIIYAESVTDGTLAYQQYLESCPIHGCECVQKK